VRDNTPLTRRLCRCVLAACAAVVAFASAGNAQEMRVTLLGTGTPIPSMDRFGPGTLVQAGGKTLIFDAGRGVTQRLAALGVEFNSLDAVFLTHLHSDHLVGLPDLWLTGWLRGRRTEPLAVFGPAGTVDFTRHLQNAFSFDVAMRVSDDKRAPAGGRLAGTDVTEGVVYESGGVKVIAFEVDHWPVTPALGYRIEFGGRSVVLSGDTRFSANLIRFAKGADLLIHEVVLAPADISESDPRYSAYEHHTMPEQAADVFLAARPRMAVFSHILSGWGLPDADIVRRTRLKYPGPLELGEDLMQFEVGDTIVVRRLRGS